MAPSDPIRLAWWNTGLAPRGISRGTQQRYETASLVMRALLEGEGAGVLTLGEMTSPDLEACLAMAGKITSKLRWRTPQTRPERASAIAVLYDPERLTLCSDTLLVASRGGDTFSTGWHLVFSTPEGGNVLNVVVVHWPSHMHEDAAGRRRSWIAGSLHQVLVPYRDVLIVGDFNDEPFSETLRDDLVAYRDRDLVRRKRNAFYNPFWRLLGERQHVEQENAGRLPAGTHFYRSGAASRWFTFDQVVVSSGLIQSNPWQLVEGATGVVLHEALLTEDGTMREVFDHLPIATAVTYRPENLDG